MYNSRVLAMIVLGTAGMTGCYSSAVKLAPAAPDQPWLPAGSSAAAPAGVKTFSLVPDPALPYPRYEAVRVEQNHSYQLPELIDIAQRTNPETRTAWEQARQAAVAVGLRMASYLPQLSAEALAGRQRQPVVVPVSPNGEGYFNITANEARPSLEVRWLLFDFGKRGGELESARQISTAADIAFTGAHQKLIFDVSRAYFTLGAEREQLRVAEESLKNSRTIQDAAEQKLAHGLGTVTEVAIAKQKTAKAEFALAHAHTSDNDAYHALLEAMGITPTLKLDISGLGGREFDRALADNTEAHMRAAVSRRPDVQAALAKFRAAQAEERSAKADFYPTIGLAGSYGQNFAPYGIDDEPTYHVHEPESMIMIKMSMPLFDAGIRGNSLKLASSRAEQARSELERTQDRALRQVSHSYDTLKSTLAEYDAACALVAAASTAYASALEAYKHGIGTFTNAVDAETNMDQAELVKARSYSDVLTAAAARAFSAGELTSAAALEP